MRLFHPRARLRDADSARRYALFEIAYTAVDFAAALLFVVGSLLFFDEATTRLGTWLFLVGSVCFALKPSLRLAREIGYWRRGAVDMLAARAGD